MWTFNCEYRNISTVKRFVELLRGAIFMKWYKVRRGLSSDPKLAVVAKRSGLTRAETLALYLTLLDLASTGSPAGSLAGFDAEEVSVSLELDMTSVEKALASFRAKKMISADNKLTCWAGRPSSSTLRVRAFRARQHQSPNPPKHLKPPSFHPDDPRAVVARREKLMHSAATPDKPPRRTPHDDRI